MSSKKHSNALPVVIDQASDRNQQRLLALKELTKVLKNNPDSLIAYKLRGTIHLELGLKREAISDLTQATKLNSEDDSAYNLLGMSHLAAGEKNLALENFSHAIILNSKNQQAFFNRGRARYALGLTSEAIADFKQAIILDTADSKTKLNQNSQNSGIFYQLGLIKKALVDLQEVDRGHSENFPRPTLVK